MISSAVFNPWRAARLPFGDRRNQHRQQVQAAGWRGSAAQPAGPVTVAAIVDSERLLRAFKWLKVYGGQAAGSDGIDFGQVSTTEAGGILRCLSRAVLNDDYLPALTRLCLIPRPNKWPRELRIATIFERCLGKSLNDAVSPIIDRIFSERVYGFRPGRSHHQMLAQIVRDMTNKNLWVIAQDDVRDAFPSVRITDAIGYLNQHITDHGVLRLLGVVLRGFEGREIGIDQGSAISPTVMNTCLHEAHDLSVSSGSCHPLCWFRYADNCVYLCESVQEGVRALQHANALLHSAGFTLKEEDGPPVDLRIGGQVKLLGLVLSLNHGRPEFSLDQSAWDKFDQALDYARGTQNPLASARNAAIGWLQSYGPAFESARDDDILSNACNSLCQHGFREIDRDGSLLPALREARQRWSRLREGNIGEECQAIAAGDGSARPTDACIARPPAPQPGSWLLCSFDVL